MLALLVWVGCNASPPQPRTSTPSDPSVDLTAPLPPQTRWTSLADFFPETPGLPVPVQGLSLGMPLDRAREVLEPASMANVASKAVDGKMVLSTVLKHAPTAAIAVVADDTGTVVKSIQFTLPAAEAESGLLEQWGMPTGLTLEVEDASYVWTSGDMMIRWATIPNRTTGLLIYERLEQ